jgi:predicted transposase YdaD
MFEYDKCGKYMIQHHGNGILRMGGVDEVPSWAPLQAELVQSRHLPDGVLEVRVPGQAKPDIYILEIYSYPDARVPSQVVCDMALSFLTRGVLPEIIVLFLHEKGNVPVHDSVELQSPRGLTKLNLSWKAIKLWEVPAEDLLAIGDVGLVPWVPLAKSTDDPERLIRRCRARIDAAVPPSPERENLLAVTQFLLGLRYTEKPLQDKLRGLLGGRQAMIESPIYQEIVAESERKGETRARRKDVLKILVKRFGDTARDLAVELDAVEYDRLEDLLERAIDCPDLESFREQLLS